MDKENTSAGTGPIHLEINALSVVNYALQQNGVPVIRSISIINESPEPLQNVELSISASPAVCLPYSKHIECVPPETSFQPGVISLKLDGAYLSAITEKTAGLLTVSLNKDGVSLCTETLSLTALTFDEWNGYGFYPELLTAFVTPNHPEIVKLTARASELLNKWTGDPSLDAYQTQDINRILSQAAAVYGAIQEQNIVYSVPPASFEPAGQRVRLCDAIFQQKMGTCLDLALLYAACLEAIGLHSLLIIQSGHIFSGLWLEDLSFPESVQDDVSLLSKRLASGVNEIAVVECTAVTAGNSATFDEARTAAERNLRKGVEYIIDVNRARLSGISPLPLRVQTGAGWVIQRPKVDERDLTAAPQMIQGAVATDGNTEDPTSKKAQWERKLLDLGLRNSLINLRLHRNMVPLLTTSIDELENAVSDGEDLTILSRPLDYRAVDGLSFETMHDLQGNEGVIQSEFKNRRLRSALTEAEVSKALKELYRASKTALEENGANTLYLALGLLRWFENPRSTRARYAPVILLPVEIFRKSASQGYVLRLRDDEPQMNVTMLEKLKQDFGITVSGLDPLPADAHGVDTRKVFTILRKTVMEQARWDVLESAYLGIFSFSQFVMWNDIRNRSADLAQNKLVRSLMDGKLAWEAKDMQIGASVTEDGALIPLPADASQLFAIESACQGESFALHGPPGTGKSQTITALIANALAQGKTVLFVAEKMAALEVVQRRLDKIGIGPFCLELHSNKSKKRDVLEQLRQATEVTRNSTAEEYAAKAQQLASLRKELDAYAQSLHRPLACGHTLFDLVNAYEQDHSAPDIPAFSPSFANTVTAQNLAAQSAAAERLVAAGKATGHPHNHPLEAVCCTQYSQQLRSVLPEALSAYRTALQTLRNALDALSSGIGEEPASDLDSITRLVSIANELTAWLSLPRSWAQAGSPKKYFLDVAEMARHFEKAQDIRSKLSQTWDPEFFQQDGAVLAGEWDAAAGKWFLPRMTAQNGLVRRLGIFAKNPVVKETLRSQLGELAVYQQEKAAADALFAVYGNGLENLYDGPVTNWPAVCQAAQTAGSSAQRLQAVEADRVRTGYAGLSDLRSRITAVTDAWNALLPAKESLYSLLTLSTDAGPDYVAQEITLCGSLSTNIGSLKEWIAWNAAAEEAASLGLGSLVDAYRDGLAHEDVLPAYRKAIFKALVMAAIDADPALGIFSGAVFNEKIRQFKRMDQELTNLTQQEIYCRLAAKIPNFAKEARNSSELGILQRAIRSGGRGISIRKLFEQIPNLLPRLCPCMLMSPISAAQYLDPKREPFSIVVFDEASQLPTCKAVGALARGENAIIVGDPKQMPPTSFFATSTVDEDNLEMEDLESILDDCLALNIPQTHLLWHYRSRHESLIAFSNNQFYENKLYTFPSVNDRASKVRLVPVDGVFERGKGRQNRAEAEAVVAELQRRCHDSEEAAHSVGVVTFNIPQQNLIDDLLSDACRTDPELEAWAYQSEEPVFIKNLENVQGDERDVILFSVGYGPDESGKVSMNFGPLNRDGGWRRLNVAVTRARCEMTVYATLKPEQIDLSRTSAEGVAALKAFLEYAEKHMLPQDENTTRHYNAQVSGIAETICNSLKMHGYETARSVGRSEYRIDIGVVDAENPEQYRLGILLDGRSYGCAKTVRDREIAQTGVLNGLGWEILRVWTMDWWDNPQRVLDQILAKLAQPRQKPVPPPPAPTTVKEPPKQLAEKAPLKDTAPKIPEYTPAMLKLDPVSSDDFLLPRYSPGIRSKISTVIVQEAPISRNLLTRRLLQSFGITRAGSRIQARLDSLYSSMALPSTMQGEQVFYWDKSQDPDSYSTFRTASSDEVRRDARDIPVQEAAAAICQVLSEQISLSEEDLVREAAKLLGYTRLGSALTVLLSNGIRYAQWKNKISLGANGNWVLPQ